jgi:hypothetical protein
MKGEQTKINFLYSLDYRMYFCRLHYSYPGALPASGVLMSVKQIMLYVTGTGARINQDSSLADCVVQCCYRTKSASRN